VRFTVWTTSLLALALLATVAGSARALGPFSRLDPRLAAALVPGSDPVGVWVEFVDKGEQGPSDLYAKLAAAERALTPKARARRLRAHVEPLVDVRDLPVSPEYLAALRAKGYEPSRVSRWMNGCVVRVSGERLAALAAMDCVRRLEPEPLAAPRRRDPEDGAFAVPAPGGGRGAEPDAATHTNVAYGMTGTQLARLGMVSVHDYGFRGVGMMVAVFDEGFNYYDTHPATRNIDVGNRTHDFVLGRDSVVDYSPAQAGVHRHGEWTLSVIGGNAPGVYLGPAFGAQFALARTEDSNSEKPIEMVNWLLAVEWADSLGADVISSSLGYRYFPDSTGTDITWPQLDGHTTIITRAVEIAAAHGILVVNSAGNDGGAGPGGIDAPADACGDSMITVGAIDSLGNWASFSSQGPTYDGRTKPDLTAQGVSVLMAEATNNPAFYWARKNGTSFSCPLVAGVATCVLGAHLEKTPVEIITALRATASMAGAPDNKRGWGVPNGFAALNWIADTAGVPGQPGSLRLALISPNPVHANGAPTLLQFSRSGRAGAPADASLRLYDALGRSVRTLWSGTLAAGAGAIVSWDGFDQDGRAAPSGLYFATFQCDGRRSVQRLTFLR
jgi:subtilisin family serine protease